ncbi:MAG TPA: exosome complex protein Rrp42 [Nanoarchaeota archaeon]|nr:exosome complex protein Rrp42 [Candidatus Pacearchaeota archaeon]HIH18196.1 exosome complex protein Rrp42 [Nanoarchaeota archaeon]HIH34567.1 exosome complex protein Rrp42 [Nanoarchaeota archaeon]HIH51859.1 exosome complex protein Rrp42 [Nanoarchaeota archaeon]HIH66558.1 exosome complex protein Rrp42 [Nanoarchaeota archaeon]
MDHALYPNKNRIISAIERGKRLDERGLLKGRKIEVEDVVSKKAEGSARVRIGATEVVVGVKLDLQTPYTDSPDEGTMMVSVELTPLSSPDFEPGPPDIKAIEMARIVDRGIRESEVIDFKQLCVEKGEKVWCVFIDIYSINDDGNLLDASALAAILALRNAVIPKIEEKKVVYGELTSKKLPLRKDLPISTTVYKIGKELVLDPSIEEEKAADARLSVAITLPDNIHAMQKGGPATFTLEEIGKVVGIAFERTKEIKKDLKI